MHLYIALLNLLLLLAACGQSDYESSDALRARRESYLGLARQVQEPVAGFVDSDKCDSLLHSALLGSGGAEVDLAAAREPSGRWLRRPTHLPECLGSGDSRSTISRDMLVGVLWYAWAHRDLDMAERLWDFWESRDWKLGDSEHSLEPMSRIYGTPTLQATLAEVIHRLGGADHSIRRTPIRSVGGQTGFRKHLELLDILLWREMTGILSPDEYLIVEQYARRYPEDALAQYVAGRYAEAERLLLRHHPEDRLLTSADICSPLTYERDGRDPCPEEGRTHAPIHFLFLSGLLLGKVR